jgi:hypothetical protein
MSSEEPPESSLSEQVWEQGWEDHEIRQLRRMSKLTFEQKLQWLEEAHKLVLQIQAGRQNTGERGNSNK